MAPKLLGRKWTTLKESWIANVPAANTSTVPRPEPAESLVSLRATVQDYAADKFNILHRDFRDDVAGLRPAILLDSIFLLVKAAHVLSAAQVHIDGGMCTWSLATAYQSAFFAMQGTAGLLGLSVAEIDNNTYVLDVGAIGDQKPTSKFDPELLTRAMKCQRVEHRQWWGLFVRLLRISSIPDDVVRPPVLGHLTSLGPTDFAKQRNKLHYVNTAWILDDLLGAVVRPGFGSGAGVATGDALDVERDDFSVILAIILLRVGHRLFADLVSLSNALKPELGRLEYWLAVDRNALYQQAMA